MERISDLEMLKGQYQTISNQNIEPLKCGHPMKWSGKRDAENLQLPERRNIQRKQSIRYALLLLNGQENTQISKIRAQLVFTGLRGGFLCNFEFIHRQCIAIPVPYQNQTQQ